MKFYMYGAIGFSIGAVIPFGVAYLGGWNGERCVEAGFAAIFAVMFGFTGMVVGVAQATLSED